MRERLGILTAAGALLVAAIAGGGFALAGDRWLADEDEATLPAAVGEPRDSSAPPVDFDRGPALSIREIYRRAAPGVVQITATSVVQTEVDPFFGFELPEQTERAQGSGFVIDKAGRIVTNYHVIAGASAGSGGEIEVSFSNNESMKATVVGADPSTDIAVLKVSASARALKPLDLGDSDTVQVGDAVVAIGNPFGLERSISAGIISALQREIEAPDITSSTIGRVIQTDAPINRGNSGGPLLSAAGEVIGVNTQIATGGSGQGNVGIGFAVPINTVKDVAAQLIEDGRVEHAFLGVTAQEITPEVARLFRLPVKRGLLIAEVTDGSAADEAGIKAGTTQVVVAGQSYVIGGDVIVKAGGRTLAEAEELRDLVASKKPGDDLKVELFRGDKKIEIDVKLGRRPASPPA